jgi:hypothetical protein
MLGPLVAQTGRLGGSFAQREIVALTFEAARSRSTGLARAA